MLPCQVQSGARALLKSGATQHSALRRGGGKGGKQTGDCEPVSLPLSPHPFPIPSLVTQTPSNFFLRKILCNVAIFPISSQLPASLRIVLLSLFFRFL